MILLLWDIDGTLLSTARAGVFALERAAVEVLGRPVDLQEMHTSGLTDAAIAARIIDDSGGDAATLHAFLEAYGRALPDSLPLRNGRVMDGVEAILEDLAGVDGVLSLLLTGNIRAGAAAKLAHYRLDRWLADGGFCEGLGPRDEIGRRAVARAAEIAGVAPDPGRTFVIGDTPLDMECGIALGVRTLGVATGEFSRADLEAAGAELVVDVLPSPSEFRALIGLPAPH